MPRDGSGVYNVPSGTYGVPDTAIESARYNSFVDDVAQDLNHPRPIIAGGTGASNADDALIAISGEKAMQTIVNFDGDLMVAGSFYALATATGAPVSGHAFVGIIYQSDVSNLVVEARDQNDTTVPGRLYVREKKAGVWAAWQLGGLTSIGTSFGIGSPLGDMFFGITGTAPNSMFAVNDKADASGTNLMTVTKAGVIKGNGICPSGAIMDFGTQTAPAGWLVCDGSAVSRATYSDLFVAIGTSWGVGDGSTTFNVPNLVNRFRRAAGNIAGAVGTLQAPCNLAHTHTGNGTSTNNSISLDHLHAGATGLMNQNNAHGHSVVGAGVIYTTNASGAGGGVGGGGTFGHAGYSFNTDTVDLNHAHSFTTNSADRSLDHTHNYGFTTSGGSGDNAQESRPYSATVLTCIKV